jgi:2-methylisocitrate lyase-like PEP mutase family enzyme
MPCPTPSILSADTHLELMRAIGEVQGAPVIADLDTGYGNAVNVAYLVPRYAAAGVAAVVIEDKTFPKDSSLRPGGRQVLVPIEEFQGKIAAATIPEGPLVVARTEALIAGSTAKRRHPTKFSNSAAPGPARYRWFWCRLPTRSCLLRKLRR